MFIIFEIQVSQEGQTAVVPAAVYEDHNDALSAYYVTLSYAVKSNCQIHTVMLVNAEGAVEKIESYRH